MCHFCGDIVCVGLHCWRQFSLTGKDIVKSDPRACGKCIHELKTLGKSSKIGQELHEANKTRSNKPPCFEYFSTGHCHKHDQGKCHLNHSLLSVLNATGKRSAKVVAMATSKLFEQGEKTQALMRRFEEISEHNRRLSKANEKMRKRVNQKDIQLRRQRRHFEERERELSLAMADLELRRADDNTPAMRMYHTKAIKFHIDDQNKESRLQKIREVLTSMPADSDAAVAVLQEIKKILVGPLKDNDAYYCSICCDPFYTSDAALKEIHLTSCGHIFHRKCLGMAFQGNPECPMCRNRDAVKTFEKFK